VVEIGHRDAPPARFFDTSEGVSDWHDDGWGCLPVGEYIICICPAE
jgi:hypothetical protein